MTSVELGPQHTDELSLHIVPVTGRGDLTQDDARFRESVLCEWHAGLARTEVAGNRVVEEVLTRNVRDIASFPLLDGPRDEWLAAQAGMPLYPAFFGSGAVTAGWQAGYIDRGDALAAALTKLGRLQRIASTACETSNLEEFRIRSDADHWPSYT